MITNEKAGHLLVKRNQDESQDLLETVMKGQAEYLRTSNTHLTLFNMYTTSGGSRGSLIST